MPAQAKRTTDPYPQSVGNVALADARVGVVPPPTAPPLVLVPGGAQERAEDESEGDALAPAMGMMVGLGLSSLLWALLLLVRALMR
jgi:hypothetical protein